MIIHKPAMAYTNSEPILSKIIQSQNKRCQYNSTFQNVPSICPYPFLLKILFFFYKRTNSSKQFHTKWNLKIKIYNQRSVLRLYLIIWKYLSFFGGEVLLFFTISICFIYNLSIYKFAELCLNLEPKLIFKVPKMLLHLPFRYCSTNCTFLIDPGRFTLQHQHQSASHTTSTDKSMLQRRFQRSNSNHFGTEIQQNLWV